MDSVQVTIDKSALEKAATRGEGLRQALQAPTKAIADRANALSSSFRTERTVRYETREHVGGTQPKFDYSVADKGKGYLGMVYTGNYAAMKVNYEQNTLLKAKG